MCIIVHKNIRITQEWNRYIIYDDGEVVMVHLTILGVPGEGSIYLYFGRVCSVPFYMKNV